MISIADVIGREFTAESYSPDEGIRAKIVGTPEAPKLEVYETGEVKPGSFGRYLKAGKTYSLYCHRGLCFDDMLTYSVPDKECEPTRGSCVVVLSVEKLDDKDELYIGMELDS
jgi:hypothetical protein